MGTNRWPKSLHSQAEALLGGIRAIDRKKGSVDWRFIRGTGTWDVYRRDIHRFVEFLQRAGQRDLRDVPRAVDLTRAYISSRGRALRGAGGSFQTIEREISALTKLSHALDVYVERHSGQSCIDSQWGDKVHLKQERIDVETRELHFAVARRRPA